MTFALMNGILGMIASYLLGTHYFQMSLFDIVRAVISSNFSAWIALLITLEAPRFPSPLKALTSGTARAWIFITSLYVTLMLGLNPALREREALLTLFFPLLLSSGFAMIAFGPLRDKVISAQQRKARIKASKQVKAPDNFPCFPTDSAVL